MIGFKRMNTENLLDAYNGMVFVGNNQLVRRDGSNSLSIVLQQSHPSLSLSASNGEYASINTNNDVKIDWAKCREAASGPKDAMTTKWAMLIWTAANPGVAP